MQRTAEQAISVVVSNQTAQANILLRTAQAEAERRVVDAEGVLLKKLQTQVGLSSTETITYKWLRDVVGGSTGNSQVLLDVDVAVAL